MTCILTEAGSVEGLPELRREPAFLCALCVLCGEKTLPSISVLNPALRRSLASEKNSARVWWL